MKKDKNIDQLIRSSLADYKPLPDVKSKERFLASATSILAESKGNSFSWKYLAIAAAILFGIMGIVYYYIPDNNSQEINNELSKTENNITVDEQEESSIEINKNTSTNETSENNKFNTEVIDESNTATTNKEPKLHSTHTGLLLHSNNDNNSKYLKQKNQIVTDYANKETNDINKLIPYSFNDISQWDPFTSQIIQKTSSNTQLYVTADIEEKKRNKKSYSEQKTLNMAYSINYSPEFVFNIIESNKIIHNIGADVHFKLFNNKYLVRTGLGASVSKGYYEYAVDYNEYLGSYSGLDSVSFAWDENHYHLLPTYYQSEREVFDTAIQTDISRVYKRFTYLRLPLILGYDFITKETYSLGVRFGPVLSVLLNNETLSTDYNPDKDKILQINQITPDRINTNWLLMAGVNVGIYSKSKLFFELEPQFSYYFNSVYQKYDATKPPFSVGIRLSVGIK